MKIWVAKFLDVMSDKMLCGLGGGRHTVYKIWVVKILDVMRE